MKEIYFIRHGQTNENSLGIRQGSEIDSELNELGREQIKNNSLEEITIFYLLS